MPTPTKGPRLGGGPAHERLILANLATSLFEHDRITTTESKAKRLRPLAERLVTFAKRGDLHARRRVLTIVRDKGVVHRLFTEIAPDMERREGGYTRITKIGGRKGDNAPMAVIELVREPLSAKKATVREAEAATSRASRGTATAVPAVPAAAPAPSPAVPAVPAEGTSQDAAVPVETGQTLTSIEDAPAVGITGSDDLPAEAAEAEDVAPAGSAADDAAAADDASPQGQPPQGQAPQG